MVAIDSRLERFLRNGNHETVTKSEMRMIAIVMPSAIRGNQTQQASTTAQSAMAMPR